VPSEILNLGSLDCISCWLACAINGAFKAEILFNAFSNCAGGSCLQANTTRKSFRTYVLKFKKLLKRPSKLRNSKKIKDVYPRKKKKKGK